MAGEPDHPASLFDLPGQVLCTSSMSQRVVSVQVCSKDQPRAAAETPLTSIVPLRQSSTLQISSSLSEQVNSFRDVDSSIDTLISSSRPVTSFLKLARGQQLVMMIAAACFLNAPLYIVRPPGSSGFLRDDVVGGDLAVAMLWFTTGVLGSMSVYFARRGQMEAVKIMFLFAMYACFLASLTAFSIYCFIDRRITLGFKSLVFIHWVFFIPNVISEENAVIRLIMRFALQGFVLAAFSAAIQDILWMVAEVCIAVLSTIVLMLLLFWRRAALKAAADLVQQDYEYYNSIWEDLVATQVHFIDNLTTTTNAIRERTPAGGPSQLCKDIDELYRQADRLQPLFSARAAKWAEATGGHLHFGEKKKGTRAVQKIMRSYSGDAGRLLDLCRGALRFPDIDALGKALVLIETDPDIVLLRVKNRFDRSYDAANSAGYRDVCLILRIVNDHTIHMGLDRHCCELQLHVTKFFNAKTDGGHARYVKWRNMRSE